jgi:uncharacterized membrane protein YccC
VSALPPATRTGWTHAALDWLRTHDRGYAALRRATRAALIMPALLALGDQVIGNPVLSTFVAFGSFAMLLLVDFTGSIRDRVQAQVALGVACCVLIVLGTLASRSAWLAAAVTVPVAFAILFAGVVSSTLAGATTSLLLAFVLPVSLPGPVSAIPDRLAGWGLAAAVSVVAIAVLWPGPARDPVRGSLIATCRAMAARLRAEVAYRMGRGDHDTEADHDAAVRAADAAIAQLQATFYATPFRPAALTTSARALVRLVDELRWLSAVVLKAAPHGHQRRPDPRVCAVKLAAADTLDAVAQLLDDPRGSPNPLRALLERVHQTVTDLEEATTARLPVLGAAPADGAPTPAAPPPGRPGPMRVGTDSADPIVSSLDPSFRAQELSFVVSQIAVNADYAAAAERRSWLERILGRQPEGLPGRLASVQERAGSHIERHSVWLHNSLRGSAALALAVLVADLSNVQHGFWVIFGTLSVLRSNALSTGQNVVRALLGTAVGFVAGAVLVALIGTGTAVLWVLLPPAVLLAGLAPATISFAAGQAAFTLTLFILFNLLAPVGWRIGLVRIEDVALGGAVSLCVGVLFWPRGAGAALGRALSQAYTETATYLTGAVAYGVGRCDQSSASAVAPRSEAVRAAAASRRLDDALRGYLSERGTKLVSLAEVTSLVTGVTGVRLAADAVVALWEDGDRAGGDRAVARAELLRSATAVHDWYEQLGVSLTGAGDVPPAPETDGDAAERLVTAVANDLRDSDGNATATGVRVIWTGDHLDSVHQLQRALVDPARALARARRQPAMGLARFA